MADRGRLRPVTVVSTEYLENPFPETGTEIHAPSVPSCLRLPSPVLSAPSLPCPRPSKLISVLTWFRVPLTSLATQNRLYSVNTSISERSDLGVPLLIGGFVRFHKDMPLSVSAYGLPHIFLPLLASFRSACHARRFQPRCSYAVLYIHYKIASQHWGTAIPNYDLFSRQKCRGANTVS